MPCMLFVMVVVVDGLLGVGDAMMVVLVFVGFVVVVLALDLVGVFVVVVVVGCSPRNIDRMVLDVALVRLGMMTLVLLMLVPCFFMW